jgi:hypothetical protein
LIRIIFTQHYRLIHIESFRKLMRNKYNRSTTKLAHRLHKVFCHMLIKIRNNL